MDPPRGASRRAGWRCPPRRSISAAWAWRTSLPRRPEALRLGLVPLLGVLVVPRLLRFLGDLVLDVFVVQLGLAAEARVRLHVEGLVEDVQLRVLRLAQRVESLLHPDVAGGARAHAAAGGAVPGPELRGGLEKIGACRDFALRFQPAARIVDRDVRHQSSRRAE